MAAKKVHISRFTPSIMDQEMLEAIFVQRQDDATDTIARIRESVLSGNKHYMLFVGPRGCGKTHFVSLIYHRLAGIEDLKDTLRVAWLNEDRTSTTVLDLNKRVYQTLNKHYPDEFPADQLAAIFDLDATDAATYLQQLLNERLGDKSALIIVENLDAMFENLGQRGQHQWRSFLQDSGKFTVLGTAQQLFPGVSDRNLPFYGFFQTTYFKPLNVQQGRDLLRNIAKQQDDKELAAFLETPDGRSRVRTLHHLSGGNHRVYVVFSEFINRKSLDELVTPFEKTLDELTPYYQERLRWLTPQQRMIVEHLCTSDRALPVKEIARALFATNQTISKQLKELKQKRYVRSAKRGRESLYELTEPLMRLAMELKENRGGPIRLIVDFLRVWYSRDELQSRLRSLDDSARMERVHVESAIAQIDCGSENLRVRALLADIGELAHHGDEQGILEAVGELQAAVGTADYGSTAARVWEQLEVRFPSLRVGAPLSAEGVPPQLVFLTPPPSPTEDQKETPKDEGPAPPAVGELATLEMGYDEEDLKVLAYVGDYRFGSIVSTLPNEWPTLPPHPETQFDEGEFIRGLRASISLTVDEKHRMLAAIPRMSQVQVDELLKIFDEERSNFASLSPKQLFRRRWEERQHARDWCELLCKSTDATNAKSWLDEHANDELADLQFVVDNPTGYGFSPEDRFWNLLNVAGWYTEHDQPDLAQEWTVRTRDFVADLDDASTQAGLLAKLSSQLRRWNQPQAALEVIDKAIELAPEDASVHSERAYVLSVMGSREEALAATEKAIELEPSNSSYRASRGADLFLLDRYQEALDELDKVLEENSDNVYAWLWKAHSLQNLRRFDEALEAYSAGIEINPGDASCFNGRAVALYAMGKYDEALESVTESLRLDPKFANANFTRVEIMLASGQWQNGWAEAEKCLQQFPPQTVPTGTERYLIQIIFGSTQQHEVWVDRLAKLCAIFDQVDAIAYVGEGLVRTLAGAEISQASSETLDRWQDAWHQVGGAYDKLSLSLRLFDAGIAYLKTREPNALLDLPVEQRAILEQLFDIDVAHDE